MPACSGLPAGADPEPCVHLLGALAAEAVPGSRVPQLLGCTGQQDINRKEESTCLWGQAARPTAGLLWLGKGCAIQ